jgi:DNA polymerase II large subunit
MLALDDFITIGTQMKIERPGKACAITPCDEAEGPWVILDDGRFLRIDEPTAYASLRPRVKNIWDNGELVIGYGEFLENNKNLVPAGYTMDWWASDVLEALSSPKDLEDFFTLLGAERTAWPEGLPGLQTGESDDPNAQFWVRCRWHAHLRA